MITKENLKYCFDDLNQKEIRHALDSNTDYILFELHVFNAGAYASVEPVEDPLIESAMGFVTDKDQFLQLFVESGSTNKELLKYI